jgi:hypothetical protein
MIISMLKAGKEDAKTHCIQDMFPRLDYVNRYFFSAYFRKLRAMNIGFETRINGLTDIVHDVFLTEIVYFLKSD